MPPERAKAGRARDVPPAAPAAPAPRRRTHDGLSGAGRRRSTAGARRPRRRHAVAAVVLAGLALTTTACAGSDQIGSPSHRVEVWMTGSGSGSAIGAIEAAFVSVDQALAQHQPAGVVRTVCAVLAQAAEAANSDLPTPDQTLTSTLSDASTNALSAGTDCYDGGAGDAALLARSAAERAKSAELLSAAISRIEQITGKVPSTTTTTNPNAGSGDPFAPS